MIETVTPLDIDTKRSASFIIPDLMAVTSFFFFDLPETIQGKLERSASY
jgi:hypothetical protein